MAPNASISKLLYISDGEDGFTFDTNLLLVALDKVGKRPFVLYSINGRSRDGKSFIMNEFLRFLNGNPNESEFPSRGGRERVTTGINLWCDPFITTRNGQEVAILLIDCQGLFDDQSTAQQNAIIYSLSSLLSSVMIYNLKEQIDESTLQQLYFHADYTQAIALDGENGIVSDRVQDLIILIRDFAFIHDYELGYHDEETCPPKTMSEGGNYFQDSMKLADIHPSNLSIRNSIQSFFHKSGMFLMPHPGMDFLKDSSLRNAVPEFQKQLSTFVTLMNSDCHSATKKVFGEEITGIGFKPFVIAWGEKFKVSDSFPSVKDIRGATIVTQNSIAVSEAINFFKEKLDQVMASQAMINGVTPELFEQNWQSNFLAAKDLFRSTRKVGDIDVRNTYEKDLEEQCMLIFKKNEEVNRTIKEKADDEAKRRLELEKLVMENLVAEEAARRAEIARKQREDAVMEAEAVAEKQRKEAEAARVAFAAVLETQRRRNQEAAARQRAELENLKQMATPMEQKRHRLAQFGIIVTGPFEWNGEVWREGNKIIMTGGFHGPAATMQLNGLPGANNIEMR